ncbi:hypothetical protein ACSBR1_020742 [Camellia fascicularis]
MGMATESQFHVLAVDDSLIDRKLIERLLKTSSYQVTTVDSGNKALKFLGLQEDDQTNPNHQPSFSPNNNQACISGFFCLFLSLNFYDFENCFEICYLDLDCLKFSNFVDIYIYIYIFLQEVEVNLIITDYCMPGMTGYDLLKKIKESSSLKNIPVVIMSSENVPARISRCLEEGAEEFFLKPVRLADVSKLKTHMLKTKFKNHQKQESQESSETEEEDQQEDIQQQQQQQSSNNNKRKAMEEGLSTDRTRPRYSGLTVV